MSRPKFDRLRNFLANDWWDLYVYEWFPNAKIGGPLERTVDWIQDYIANPIIRLLCKMFGHVSILDHCGRPEHAYCLYCRHNTWCL